MARKRQRSRGTGTRYKRNGRGPWIASWYDHSGKRKERSTRTTDKAAAERILNKLVADVALRLGGVVDATKDRYATEARKPLSDHVREYIAHCRHVGQAPRHVFQKESHLRRLREGVGVTRLSELTADLLELHLQAMRDQGLSARSLNFARQIAVAFASWCVKTGRAEANALRVVPKLDESCDRRRVRRPLTDDELARLLAVAEGRGRKAWYLAAALAGLRRGDLQRLTWTDIDFAMGAITVSGGKAKRLDVIPMHPQLADALRRRRDESLAMPTAKVFPQTVTTLTVLKDFLRAGLAYEEIVTDDSGEPVMIGEGKRRRPKTRIAVEDAEGRVIDLHAMRTTLGTNLARAGVAPQIAQRIMRHADYRTTLKHYTVLELADTAKAIGQLPTIQPDERQAATGTCDTHAHDSRPIDPQLYPQQLGRETVRRSAVPCDDSSADARSNHERNPLPAAAQCDTTRRRATTNDEAGEGARTLDIQLGRLRGPHATIATTRAYKRARERLYQRLYHAGRFRAF